MQDIYILASARTPLGVLQGALSDVSAIDLGVIAAKGALERSNVSPQLVDRVVISNVIQSSKDAIYLTGHVALKAGLPIDIPALTVNRLCGSGLQAIVNVAQMLLLREGEKERCKMPRDTREPQEILEHITRARVALISAIYGLSEEQLLQAGAVGKWLVKDVMAHIGRWESVCFEVLRNHLQGKQPEKDYSQVLALNDEWEAELQALSLEQAIDFFETAHHHMFGVLSSLNPEQWNGYVRAWVTGSTWHHFEEHAEQIRAWRKLLPH